MELAALYRYTIPSDELEFLVRLNAPQQHLWKMGLPSAFSWLKPIWNVEGWMQAGANVVGFFSKMFNNLLRKKRKK